MKQKILLTLVFCIFMTGLLYSQDRPSKHRGDGEKRPSTEEMVKRETDMLKRDLDLTETQETFVKKILNDSYKKMEDNFKSGNKDRDEMEKIMTEKDNNIKQVLTDEQWTKYKDMKEKHKNKFKDNDKNPPEKENP